MAEALQRLVRHLADTYDLDPVGVAEALWLWQQPGFGTHRGSPTAAGGAGERAGSSKPPGGDDPSGIGDATERIPLYLGTTDTADFRPASVAFPYRVRAPLDGLAFSRALRPFRRRWPRGHRSVLDVPATVRGYAATGAVVPLFRAAPERWFDVDVVVDTSVSMAVWADTVNELVTLLAGLGVFRSLRRHRLDAAGRLVDAAGHQVQPSALHAADGRRLIIVLSDCAGPWWYTAEAWLMLRSWARNTPTALVNPLPTTSWPRTALSLPTVRLTATVPGAHHRDLVAAGSRTTATALPIPALTPHAVGRWARAVMHTDPNGCDGTLIPSSGRVPEPQDEEPDGWGPPPSAVEALRLGASPRALRVAVLCAVQDYDELHLSVLHVIRQELVPDADANDLAAVLTGGIFDPVETADGVVLRFRTGTRTELRTLETASDVWDRYRAISRHVAAMGEGTARFPVLVADPVGRHHLPAGASPAGEARRSDLARLGLTVQDRAPQPASGPTIVDDPAAPVFFLSYARAARSLRAAPPTQPNAMVQKLFDDLVTHVSELVGLPAGSDAGFMDRQVDGGERWESQILRSAGTCQVFVSLLSPAYLRSRWCGFEWDAFTRRTAALRQSSDEPVTGMLPILPVIWVPMPQRDLPAAVSEYQWFRPDRLPDDRIVEAYQQEGLYGLLRIGRREYYDMIVWRLAQEIVTRHFEYWVEPLVPPDTQELRTFDEADR